MIISLLVSGYIVDQYYVCLSSLMSMEADSQCDVWRNSKQACSVHCFIDFSVHPGGRKQPHFRWCTHHTAITGDILRVNAALLEVSSDAAATAFWVMRPIQYWPRYTVGWNPHVTCSCKWSCWLQYDMQHKEMWIALSLSVVFTNWDRKKIKKELISNSLPICQSSAATLKKRW